MLYYIDREWCTNTCMCVTFAFFWCPLQAQHRLVALGFSCASYSRQSLWPCLFAALCQCQHHNAAVLHRVLFNKNVFNSCVTSSQYFHTDNISLESCVQWHKFNPKTAPSLWWSPPPSNKPIPWPTPLTTPNGIWIQSAILPQYTFRTNRERPTDGLGDVSKNSAYTHNTTVLWPSWILSGTTWVATKYRKHMVTKSTTTNRKTIVGVAQCLKRNIPGNYKSSHCCISFSSILIIL